MLETRRGPHDMDVGKEGEASFKSSMDESSGCTVDDATDGPEKKTKVQSHQLSRLQKLRAHHKACEERYMKAYTKTLNDEGEKTLHLYQSMKTKKVHQSSDDSDGTVTLDPTPDMDTSVPELRRTDSVILNRKMLGYAAEEPLSSSELSEDEYIPETEEESDCNSSADEEGLAKNVKQHKKGKVKSKTSRSQPCKRRRVTRSSSLANSGTKESSSSDEYDTEESSSPDHSDVTVMMLKKKTDGGRLYNKKYYCLFCSKPFSKMARHLESKHKDMPEVARAVAFPKGSKERRLQLSFLRNKGNRCHNAQVLKGGTGTVIPRQQTIAPVRASDNLHCVKEMDDLADFLGHNIKVHQQYYQLPEGSLQQAKISKSLMAVERGQLSEFKGRNLDEIQIDPQGKNDKNCS